MCHATLSLICLSLLLYFPSSFTSTQFRCPLGQQIITPGLIRSYCSPCPSNTFGPDGIDCFPCPSQSSTARCTGSVCNPAQSISECLCQPGFYAMDVGRQNMTCVPCPRNTFNSDSGGTGINACTPCDNFVQDFTSPGATLCPCKAGFYWNKKQCMSCPTGSYSNGTNATSSDACIPCPAGTYGSSTGATSCNKCPSLEFSSSKGSTECMRCSALCQNDSFGSICSKINSPFIPNQLSTTCRFDGPLCLYDEVNLIPGAATVSELISGAPYTLDMNQSWAISAWFYLKSKHDRQVLFSFMALSATGIPIYSPGNIVVTVHPQNFNRPISVNIASVGSARAHGYTTITPYFSSNPLMIQRYNWVYINYDSVSSQASLSFAINNQSNVRDINLNERRIVMLEMSPTTIFLEGTANSSAFLPLVGGVYGTRLFSASDNSWIPSILAQPIFSTASALALGCPSDLYTCTKANHRIKMPNSLSFETLPSCECVGGYYKDGESDECIPCPSNSFCSGNVRKSCPAHLPLSDPLATSSYQCFANITEQYINPVAMPNVDITGRGYDLYLGNPQSMNGQDPGLRRPVFDLNLFDGTISNDQRYIIPDGTNLYPMLSCRLDFSATIISSATAYSKKLESKVSVEAKSTSFAFKGSAEFQSVNEGATSRGSTFTSTDAECSLYTLFINVGRVKLHPTFSAFIRDNIEQLASWKNETHFNTAISLVNEFGSHFPTQVIMGSRYGEVLEIRQEYVKTSSSTMISAQAQASAKFGLGSVSVSASFRSDSSVSSEFSKNVTNRYIFSVGSTPPTNGDASTWAAQSIQNPAVIGMHKLKPITDLLTPHYFPDIPPSRLIAAQEFIGDYLIKRCPHCNAFLDDYDICFGGFVVNSINTLTRSVGCPNNYIMSPPLISENNMWGLSSLNYCYHKERCKTRLPSSAPRHTDSETNGFTSFGGVFTRLIYYSSTNADDTKDGATATRAYWESGQEIDLLSFLMMDGVPILDTSDQDWADWYDEASGWVDSIKQSKQSFDERVLKFFRPFDDLRYKISGKEGKEETVRALFRSEFKLSGNSLNDNKFSCSEGFVEFFAGVFYSHRGQEKNCRYCNRRRNAHAALFICIAADMTENMKAQIKRQASVGDAASPKRGSMPVSGKQCGVEYNPGDDAKKLLFASECTYPRAKTPFVPASKGALYSTPQDFAHLTDHHIDNESWKTTYVHPILSGGEYTPVEGASIGGIFARGNDMSIIIPPRPEYPYNKLYISADSNWLFHGKPTCPPGYREYVLFSTKSLGSRDITQEWFHIDGSSSDVIMCLLTSRTSYETATLGAADALALIETKSFNPFPGPNINQTLPVILVPDKVPDQNSTTTNTTNPNNSENAPDQNANASNTTKPNTLVNDHNA